MIQRIIQMGGEYLISVDPYCKIKRKKSSGFTKNLFLVLCICIGFLCSQVGSRQDVHNISIQMNKSDLALKLYQSSFHTTGTDLGGPRKTRSLIRNADTSVKFVFHKNEKMEENEGKKSLPQIVPLPPPKGKSFSDGMTRMIALYRDFVTDFAIYKGWSSVYLLIPEGQSSDLCNYFTAAFLSSKAALRSQCGTEAFMNQIKTGVKGDPQLSGQKTIPIFSFYFLENANKTVPRGVAIQPQLLIHYIPSRPIFVLAGTESKDVILDQIQPEFQTNYKWTLVALPNSSSETMNLDDVYGFATSLDPIPQFIGTWSGKLGVKIDSQLVLGLADFKGRTLRITTVSGPPFVYVDSSSGRVKCRGYLPDILDNLSLQLNFTYELLTPSDNKFGNVDQNGSWSGMVGQLQRKEVEIALMSFSLTSARKIVMDFSPPVEYSSVRLLIRRDWQNAELKWSAYLTPFSSNVWFAIPICIALGVITLAVFSYYKILEMKPGRSAWLLSSCFVLQGQTEHGSIKAIPYRMVIGTFWVLSVVVFASYTARLTAFLAASTDNLPVQSLAEAVKNKNWKIGLTKGSAFIDRIKESRVEVLRGLYGRLSEDSSALVENFQEGMDKVFKERYIFFTSELIPAFLIKGNCSYTWLPDKYFSGFGYMGYQKNLPLSPIISQRVAELRQTGQMQRLFRKWWGTESICYSSNTGDSFLGMSLYETGTAFLILILGISISVTLLFGEVFRRHRNPLSHSSTSNKTDAIINNKPGTSISARILESHQLSSNPYANNYSGYSYTADFSFPIKRQVPNLY